MQELSKIKASDNEQFVVYDNKINAQMTGLRAKDYDLFMVCAYKLKDMANQSIEVGYREIMDLMQYKRHMSFQELHQYLKDEESISDIKFTFIDEDGDIHKRPLFKAFDTKWRNKKLVLKVNDEFADYFSNLQKNFTELDLIIYTSLKSKYSKILYQNLCQFRGKNGKGWWDIPLEDNVRESQPVGFITLFEVSEKAVKNKRRIMDDIIKPSVMELAPYMAIEVTPVYGTGRGKPLIGYHFDFKPAETKAIKEKKPKIRELTDKEKKEYNELVANAEQIELFNSLSSKIKAITDLDDLSVKMIVDTAESQNKGDDEVVSICEYAIQQNTNNLAAYIISLIAKGFSAPKKTSKKNGFNNYGKRKAPTEEWENRYQTLLEKNLLGIKLTPEEEEEFEQIKRMRN